MKGDQRHLGWIRRGVRGPAALDGGLERVGVPCTEVGHLRSTHRWGEGESMCAMLNSIFLCFGGMAK